MMYDMHGRRVTYLRLSVTKQCNFRCLYCMAEGVMPRRPDVSLSLDELCEIGTAAVRCGIEKIRVTGGEPLSRPGVAGLCEKLKRAPGLAELTLTTNAVRLGEMAAELKAAGVDRLNVSLDSLRPDRFRTITRGGDLEQVWKGLTAAEAAGFRGLKLNVVLLRGINEDEIADFAALTRDRDWSVRFIELMPMGPCADFTRDRFLPAETVLRTLPSLEALGGSGVAELYRLPGHRGTVGLIRPMSGCFCAACNRVRVTADGKLKPCLHSAAELSLRGLHGTELEEAIRAGVRAKPERHHLRDADSAALRGMYEIGG